LSTNKLIKCNVIKQKVNNVNVNYLTTITKNVVSVGIDVCVRVVFVGKETRVPGGNPIVRLVDHVTILYVDAVYANTIRCTVLFLKV